MRYQYYLSDEQLKCLPSDKGGNLRKAFQYAKLMAEGVRFPPVQIYFNKDKNSWDFNDGRHRVLAARMAGVPLLVRSYRRMGYDQT